jgi:fibromodulin
LYLFPKLSFSHPPSLFVPPEFSISSFCTVVDVMNFSKLQVLRLDGNEIKRSAMPVDAPLCLRLANLIEI